MLSKSSGAGETTMVRIRRGLLAATIASWFSTWVTPARAKSIVLSDIAKFREFVMAAFRKRPGIDSVVGDSGDPAKFEIVMCDWSSTGDVTNLFGYLRAYPDEDVDKAVSRFINSLMERRSSTVVDDMIVAVIRTRDYVDDLLGTGVDVLYEPLGADLVVLFMADRPDSLSTIQSEDLPGKPLSLVRKLALSNVRKWLPKIRSDDQLGDGVLYYVYENPTLSTSLIILDEFWKSISKRFPGDALIAIPRKDQLFVFEDGNPRARAHARQLIAATFQENFNLLSPKLYARRNGAIVAVPG